MSKGACFGERGSWIDALRDWAAHGKKSCYLKDAAKIEAKRGQATISEMEAAASFRLGVFLAQEGHLDTELVNCWIM